MGHKTMGHGNVHSALLSTLHARTNMLSVDRHQFLRRGPASQREALARGITSLLTKLLPNASRQLNFPIHYSLCSVVFSHCKGA